MSVTLSATASDGTEANHRTAGRDNPSTVTTTQRAVDEIWGSCRLCARPSGRLLTERGWCTYRRPMEGSSPAWA